MCLGPINFFITYLWVMHDMRGLLFLNLILLRWNTLPTFCLWNWIFSGKCSPKLKPGKNPAQLAEACKRCPYIAHFSFFQMRLIISPSNFIKTLAWWSFLELKKHHRKKMDQRTSHAISSCTHRCTQHYILCTVHNWTYA